MATEYKAENGEEVRLVQKGKDGMWYGLRREPYAPETQIVFDSEEEAKAWVEKQMYACHECHNPEMDQHLGFSPLPLGEYEAAKKHYRDTHNLFLPPNGVDYFESEEEWRAFEERQAQWGQRATRE